MAREPGSNRAPDWVEALLKEDEQEKLKVKTKWLVMLRSLDLPGTTKAVLLWLYERMYASRTEAFPSQELLARDSGVLHADRSQRIAGGRAAWRH